MSVDCADATRPKRLITCWLTWIVSYCRSLWGLSGQPYSAATMVVSLKACLTN